MKLEFQVKESPWRTAAGKAGPTSAGERVRGTERRRLCAGRALGGR